MSRRISVSLGLDSAQIYVSVAFRASAGIHLGNSGGLVRFDCVCLRGCRISPSGQRWRIGAGSVSPALARRVPQSSHAGGRGPGAAVRDAAGKGVG